MQDEHHGFGRGALRAVTMAAAGAGLLAAGPTDAATRGFTITSFDAVRIDAPVSVVLTTGTGASARAEGDQTALDRMKVDISGRLLIVGMERGPAGTRSAGAATLRLSTAMIERVVLTGGGSVAINRLKGQRGEIALGGNGDVSVAEVDLDRIDVTLTGGGRVTLAGRANIANAHVSGPGALVAEPLRVRQATLGNNGPGSMALTADVTAKVVASGSGDVTVTGKAACTVDNRGTGRVACGGEEY